MADDDEPPADFMPSEKDAGKRKGLWLYRQGIRRGDDFAKILGETMPLADALRSKPYSSELRKGTEAANRQPPLPASPGGEPRAVHTGHGPSEPAQVYVSEVGRAGGLGPPSSPPPPPPQSPLPPPPQHGPDGALPRTWKEAVPYVIWVVLILGFGLEFVTALLHAEWLRALLAFAGLLGLMTLALHWKQIKGWAAGISPNWVVGAFALLLLTVTMMPIFERWPLPASQGNGTFPQRDLRSETKARLLEFYVAAGPFLDRDVEHAPKREEVIIQFVADAKAWEAATAQWIEEKLGPAARARFLDQSNAPTVTWLFDLRYSEMRNRLISERKNLDVLIQSGAYDK